MTPAEIRTAVDAKLATLWATIQTRETAYFAAHGRYWQGLRTHAVDPADGAEALPSVGTATPDYEPDDPWPEAILNAPWPMSIELSQYAGPNGLGYVGTVSVTIVGNTWQRSAQVGPETQLQQGWHRVDVVEP